MEFLKFYSKEKANFYSLIKLLFIKDKCLKMFIKCVVSLEIHEGQQNG